MIIVRLLLPSLLVGFGTNPLYSGLGADIVMESITLIDRFTSGSKRVDSCLIRKLHIPKAMCGNPEGQMFVGPSGGQF